jgi:hypothetical protein
MLSSNGCCAYVLTCLPRNFYTEVGLLGHRDASVFCLRTEHSLAHRGEISSARVVGDVVVVTSRSEKKKSSRIWKYALFTLTPPESLWPDRAWILPLMSWHINFPM